VAVGAGSQGRTASGFSFQLDPERNVLRLRQLTAPANGPSTSPDDGAARLPNEAPTGIDPLDLMLVPSYWLRATVEPNATRVVDLGGEEVDGRAARKIQILFGGPALEKYGKDGWTWWIDAEVG